MPKFRVRLTETTVYKEVVIEAKDCLDAEEKHTAMLDRGELEVAYLDDTCHRIDEI